MEFLEEFNKSKKIKLEDDDLYDLVAADRDEAERYFDSHIADAVVLRYQLLNANKDYYVARMARLSEKSSFVSSDIKDAVEWIMPSLTEVYFGADRIVGFFGRTPDDDPAILEKVIKFQTQTQNNDYLIIDQWCRDGLESGLGAIHVDWEKCEEIKYNWYLATPQEFFAIPPEEVRKNVKRAEPTPDGNYKLLVKDRIVKKDQLVIKNVRPGEYIYLPEKDADGINVFECRRHYMLYDDIRRLGKAKIFKNTEDDFPFLDTKASDSDSLDRIYDAMTNYNAEDENNTYLMSADTKTGQEGRKRVLVYDCFGKYDVDGDGILERVHVIICNGRVLYSKVWEYDRWPFQTISFFPASYQKWKEAVADFLQDIQDIKTALIRQIIINTALNNDPKFGVDASQTTAVKDLENGKKLVRINLMQNQKVGDFLQALPQHKLAPETMPLIEMIAGWQEQKLGITRYNQGLDSDSLNKTATGISKIMAASQQRLRKMARDGAETGIVPMYKFIIELDKKNLKEEFVFRITNNTYQFRPDDIKGEFDVKITSNIGLQDKAITAQNLMLVFEKILPPLLQIGAASPQGMFETAKQVVEELGFNNPDKFLGMEAAQVSQLQGQAQTEAVMQQLPMLLAGALKESGVSPERSAAAVQSVMRGMQQMSAAPQTQQMQEGL